MSKHSFVLILLLPELSVTLFEHLNRFLARQRMAGYEQGAYAEGVVGHVSFSDLLSLPYAEKLHKIVATAVFTLAFSGCKQCWPKVQFKIRPTRVLQSGPFTCGRFRCPSWQETWMWKSLLCLVSWVWYRGSLRTVGLDGLTTRPKPYETF